jgi:hypothetical protein
MKIHTQHTQNFGTQKAVQREKFTDVGDNIKNQRDRK